MQDKRLFSSDLAQSLKSRKGQKYRPSNGTEGCMFMEAWCEQCQKDTYQETPADFGCEILARTMAFDINDEEYPAEWQYSSDGQPICTAFVEKDS